ncbi:MAG: radical SAM protein [Thermodesulfobacteriota bacterium]
MKHLFGPVLSRRLGRSLGIDLLPAKICTFNCVYCEVRTPSRRTCQRQEYVPTGEILEELAAFLAKERGQPACEVFTVTASGEPTLHTGIGQVIAFLKAQAPDRPVAVLTNGTLLGNAEVRADLAAADIVVPSLDACREESFLRVNRPAPGIRLAELIAGLVAFRRGYRGQCWLEILFVAGINDAPADIACLKEAVAAIRPHRIQVNTVARPPLEPFARPVPPDRLAALAQELGEHTEVIAGRAAERGPALGPVAEAEILALVQRRPETAPAIARALGLSDPETLAALDRLHEAGQVTAMAHQGRTYFVPAGRPRKASTPGRQG